MTAAMTRQAPWRGIIAHYGANLPVPAGVPVITLGEGGTPLLPAPVLSELTGCSVYLKVEGVNPTGSFKDRGMTVAVTLAAARGAHTVICASTGNTSASAVLGDLVAVARNRVLGGRGPRESAYAGLSVRPMGQTPTRYHISLDVADRAGVLAQVAAVFAEHDVSIAAVRQEGRTVDASLVIVTHAASDAALRSTVDKIAGLPVVREVVSVMRVEGEAP